LQNARDLSERALEVRQMFQDFGTDDRVEEAIRERKARSVTDRETETALGTRRHIGVGRKPVTGLQNVRQRAIESEGFDLGAIVSVVDVPAGTATKIEHALAVLEVKRLKFNRQHAQRAAGARRCPRRGARSSPTGSAGGRARVPAAKGACVVLGCP